MIVIGCFLIATVNGALCIWYVGSRSNPTLFFDWAEEKLRYCIKRHEEQKGIAAVIYLLGCLALLFWTFERKTRPGKINLIYSALVLETAAELAVPGWPDVVLGIIKIIQHYFKVA